MGNYYATTVRQHSTSNTEQESKHQLVVAIDIGTYASGFAYQHRTDFKHNRCTINASKWPDGRYKTTTSLLLNPDHSFNSFGSEARKTYYKYKTLDIEDKPENWQEYLFFERFKMYLYFREEDQIDDNLNVEAENQKYVPAIVVFTETIKFMKNKFLEHLETGGILKKTCAENVATPDHIMWVITVPAIWGEPAKQLMYRAAVKAGISSEKLELALEPECAAIHCCNMPPEKLQIYGEDEENESILKPDAVIMVADIGGGTVDIAVMMINDDKTLKQVYKSGGNAYGGVRINNQILQELKNVFGEDVMREFCQQYGQDEKELHEEIERAKREWTEDTQYSIKLSRNLEDVWKSHNEEKNLNEHLSKFKVKKEGSYLLIDRTKFEHLIIESVDGIYDYLEKVMSDEFFINHSVNALLVVGGFAESTYLVKILRDRLKDRRIPVIRPEDPERSVLNGAALYGHDEGMVSSRIMTKTYGVAMTTQFIRERHNENEKYINEKGEEMTNNAFRKHIEAGQVIRTREWIQGKTYYPESDNDKNTRILIFQSDKRNPQHTTEKGCTYIGHVDVDFPDRKDDDERKVIVDFYFAGTFIKVRAKTAIQTITLPISRN